MNYQTNIIIAAHGFERMQDANGKNIASFMLSAPMIHSEPRRVTFDWDELTALRAVAAEPHAPAHASLALGRRLGELLLTTEIRNRLAQALAAAGGHPSGEIGVRLRLALAGELQRVPWEFMTMNMSGGELTAQDFLALHPKLSIVRDPPQLDSLPTDKTFPDTAVRMFVAMASPRDLPALDLDAEAAALDAVLNRPGIERKTARPARAIDLVGGGLRAHVFHFAGHGDFEVDPASPVPGTVAGSGRLPRLDWR
jgi:hypothetical protein